MKHWKALLIIFIAAAMLALGYLLSSSRQYRVGFPLDDAWIHQTFARNLAEHGDWDYNPGEPSAGSTSPFWTLLLAVGCRLGIDHLVWAYLLGVMALSATGYTAYRYLCSCGMGMWRSLIISGLIFAEWHLVWSQVSGMEILLLVLLALLVTVEALRGHPRWWLLGLLLGVAVWTRPDGITLLAPVLWVWFLDHRADRPLKSLAALLLPVTVFTGLYLYLNYHLSGGLLPNTFSAKQQEYLALLSQPFPGRTWNMLKTILAGPGILWLPGFLAGMVLSIQRRKISALAPYLWVAGYIFMYAVRLPVSYQHARYLMPVLAVFMLFSVQPLIDLSRRIKAGNTQFIVSRVYAVTLILVTLLFLAIGAGAYARDTAIIEQEMVDTAVWIDANTPADTLIAAHDIGALGYFGNRRILDLAGLVTPQVIPFIRDSEQLSSYIREQDADYLVIFPNWYTPPLSVNGKVVYPSGEIGNHMQVIKLE